MIVYHNGTVNSIDPNALSKLMRAWLCSVWCALLLVRYPKVLVYVFAAAIHGKKKIRAIVEV